MQYIEHIILGVCLLIFLGVVGAVGLGVLLKLTFGAKPKPKPSAAAVYTIPPSERNTGQHISLLDLVDDHVSSEDLRRRREKISTRLYDWTQSDPK